MNPSKLYLLLFSALPVLPFSQSPTGEGFYPPDAIELPSGVEQGLPSVVRVKPKIYFRVILYTDREGVETHRESEAPRKQFLPEDGVIWNTPLDTATMNVLAEHPIAQVQPGFKEITELNWRESCVDFPCPLVTKVLSGSGTGVVVGRHPDYGVLIATPYHVARESIERHERTGGISIIIPDPAPDISVGIDTNGVMQEGGYVYTDEVQLLANASEQEWRRGLDWALISIPDKFAPYVTSADLRTEIPTPGDTLWAAGFPFRTIRESAEEKGYPNADDELRITKGITAPSDTLSVSSLAPENFVNTMDAVNGSSGSPVFDRQGRVVGMVRDGYCIQQNGELNIRIAQYCGVALIVPMKPVRRLMKGLED